MILRRVAEHLSKQHWAAVFLDFVIVVVGVFVGIQAANWNESRKGRVEEHRYYVQLLGDLRADQRALQNSLQRAAIFDTAAENTLKAIRSGIPQTSTPGRFAVDVHYAGWLYIPRPSRGTYDELISTGNLGLLQDGAAKAAIADYYSKFDEFRQWDVLLRSQQDRYWEATSGVLPRQVLRDAIRGREPTLSAADAHRILTALRERNEAADMLVMMAVHQERVRQDSERLEEKGRALIAKLEPLTAN